MTEREEKNIFIDEEEKENVNGNEELKDIEELENDSVSLMKKLIWLIEKVGRNIERFNLAEYVNLLNSPRRFLTINFLGGVARGLGFALGATVFAALLIYFLQRIMVLNLPLIGNFISDLVKIVQDRL